jgi:hypothetical protein
MPRRLLLAACWLAGCHASGLPIPPAMTNQAVASCRFDAPVDRAAVVFAAVSGGQLVFVHGDGSHSVAYTFAAGAAPGAQVAVNQVSARGDFIAAGASWTVHGSFAGEELVLLDRSGARRWSKSWDAATNRVSGGWYLNEKGVVAVPLLDAQSRQFSDGLVIDAAGSERAIAGAIPMAEATPDGFVPVASRLATQLQLGWMAPGSASLQPLAYEPFDWYDAHWPALIDGRFVYVGKHAGALALVSERPGDARATALPAPADGYVILDATAEGWALVVRSDFDVTSLVRVNLRSGAAAAVALPTTGGLRPVFVAGAARPSVALVPDGTQPPRLDVDGALLAGLRDDAGGALYRANGAGSWARVGESMSRIGDIAQLAHGGVHLVLGVPWQEVSFVAPTETGKTDRVGGALQIVRADGTTQVLSDAEPTYYLAPPQLSPDGQCAAYVAVENGVPALRAVDVERGHSFELLAPQEAPSPASLYTAAWVPRQK